MNVYFQRVYFLELHVVNVLSIIDDLRYKLLFSLFAPSGWCTTEAVLASMGL